MTAITVADFVLFDMLILWARGITLVVDVRGPGVADLAARGKLGRRNLRARIADWTRDVPPAELEAFVDALYELVTTAPNARDAAEYTKFWETLRTRFESYADGEAAVPRGDGPMPPCDSCSGGVVAGAAATRICDTCNGSGWDPLARGDDGRWLGGIVTPLIRAARRLMSTLRVAQSEVTRPVAREMAARAIAAVDVSGRTPRDIQRAIDSAAATLVTMAEGGPR